MKTDRNTLKEACYQYLLDHTYPHPKGHVVNFILPTKNKFFKKIQLREKGYKRQLEEEQIERFASWQTRYNNLIKTENHQRFIAKRHTEISKNGTLYQKLILKIKALCNKKINKWL